MARKRRVAVAALNIRMHPHSAEGYERLVRRAYALRGAVRYRGDQYLIISQVERSPDSRGAFGGTLARFTEIDAAGAWFNTENLEKADERDIRRINIPDALKPNFKAFFFDFFVRQHAMVFQINGVDGHLSPRLTKTAIEKLLNQPPLQKEFGVVDVDIVSSSESLKRILAIPRLRHLTIEVSPPNADDQEEFEEEIERRLREQRARRLTERYDSLPKESLKPDEETVRLARLAMKHGKVVAEGRDDNNNPVEVSSLDYPSVGQVRYDPDLRTERQAFSRASDSMIESFRSDRARR
jgi:hypothetical protein